MSEELPEPIRRVEMYYNADREPVKKIEDASFKYVTVFDENGKIEEQYSIEIVDGIDPEHEEAEEYNVSHEPSGSSKGGQFASKGSSSQLGDLSQTKTIRDRTFGRELGNLEKLLQSYKDGVDEKKKLYDEEPEDTLRKRNLNHTLHNWEDYVKRIEQKLETFKQKRDEFNKLDLFEIGTGKNSHRRGFKEYKNGISKNIITNSGWKLNQPRDFLNVKDGGYRVLESEFDNAVKGKTIIDSNIPPEADPKVLKLGEEVKYVWNSILSDQERGTVDILRIKYSEQEKFKGRGANRIRTLGTHGGRSVIDSDTEGEKMIISPSVLTVHLAYNDKRSDVLNTVAHELAHARWATEVEPNKEKMTKFTDKIVKMGKENALTEYAGSYFDDLETSKEEAKQKWKEEVNNAKTRYGKADHQTQAEFETWRDEQILSHLTNRYATAKKDYSENIKKAEQLIANETHSEYFGMVSAPTDRAYHTVDKVKLEKMSKMIKEGLYND